MRFLVWKILIGFIAFDLLLLARNFATLHRVVRNWKTNDRKAPPDATDRLCEAIAKACSWYPKRALCLQRSAVTTCLLRNYGIPAEMVIGAQRLPFKAHAWVEINGRAINERNDVQAIYGTWERC